MDLRRRVQPTRSPPIRTKALNRLHHPIDLREAHQPSDDGRCDHRQLRWETRQQTGPHAVSDTHICRRTPSPISSAQLDSNTRVTLGPAVASTGRSPPQVFVPADPAARMRGSALVAARAWGANMRRAFCVTYRHLGDSLVTVWTWLMHALHTRSSGREPAQSRLEVSRSAWLFRPGPPHTAGYPSVMQKSLPSGSRIHV